MLAFTTFGIHLMTQGVFQSLFPLQSKAEAGLTDGHVGTLISIAAVVTLVFAFPNGMLVDRFGRKSSLVPGLLLLGATAVLLSMSRDYTGALIAAVVYGLGQTMTTGASQTYAMDLAPENSRARVHRRLVGLPEPRIVRGPAGGRPHRRRMGVRRRVSHDSGLAGR